MVGSLNWNSFQNASIWQALEFYSRHIGFLENGLGLLYQTFVLLSLVRVFRLSVVYTVL